MPGSTLSRIFPSFFLVALLPLGILAQGGPEVVAPSAPPILLDGVIGAEEWEAATRQPMTGGGEVLLMAHEGSLFVGVRGPEFGLVHVAVAVADSLWILHASSALGAIVYVQEGETWRLSRSPVWELRDSTQSAEARAAREAYLSENRWVASIAEMGATLDHEFILQLPRFGEGEARIGAAFFPGWTEEGFPRWPQSARGALNDQELLMGERREVLEFHPEDWARVVLPTARRSASIPPDRWSGSGRR